MESLLGKNIEELREVALSVGLPKFAATQLAEWIYICLPMAGGELPGRFGKIRVTHPEIGLHCVPMKFLPVEE